MKRVIILVVTMVLAGCQTTRPVVPPDPGIACAKALETNPEFSIIAGKVALVDPRQQTFSMLINTSKPDQVEKVAIAKWITDKQACYALTQRWRAQYNFPSTLSAIDDANNSKFLNLSANLYNGKLTYGQYAKARAKVFAEVSQQWAEEVQHLRDMQAAAEAQRRRMTAMFLLTQHPYQVQLPQPAEIPTTTTNCFVVGNEMRCTTQ
ncbi:MAG: hypothetical protein ACYDDA_01775 [Acidiferrobacteraceae bacterium]